MLSSHNEIELRYGTGSLKLHIPPDRRCLARPQQNVGGRDPLEALQESLDHPRGSQRPEDIVRDKSVTYFIEDATRSEPHAAFMRAGLPRLKSARNVTAIMTTGSHDRFTEGNKRIVRQFRSIASKEGLRAEILIHDCLDDSCLVTLGETPRGTPVEVNARALECEVFVVNSDMKNHYFAGYCNALKNFLPGICSYRAIEANHSLALDPEST